MDLITGDVLVTRSHTAQSPGEYKVQVWDLETHALRMTIPNQFPPAVFTDADGQSLIVLHPRYGPPEIHLYKIPLRPEDEDR